MPVKVKSDTLFPPASTRTGHSNNSHHTSRSGSVNTGSSTNSAASISPQSSCCSAADLPHSPSSPLPYPTSLSMQLPCGITLQQNGDAASSSSPPPLREKTCKPMGAETPAVNSNASTSPDFSFRVRPRDPNCHMVTTQSQAVGVSSYHTKENKSHGPWDSPSLEHDGGESRTQREWARSLQKCLLEAEAELHRSRQAAKVREREFLAASIEMSRLLGLVSSQNRRIEELERKLASMKPFAMGKNSNPDTIMNPTTIANVLPLGFGTSDASKSSSGESNSFGSLDGLSVSCIREVVHSATNALCCVETQYEREKYRRRALEKENNELRHRLSLAYQSEGRRHPDDSHHRCNNEKDNCAMSFFQGALRQFLIDASEAQERVEMSGTHHTTVQS